MIKPFTIWITTKGGKFLKEMGIPDHLTCFLRNLYAGQEATVRTRRGSTGASLVAQMVKESACNAGDLGSIPGLGSSNPHQYSCLENSMDGGAWWATVHGVAKSQTRIMTSLWINRLVPKEYIKAIYCHLAYLTYMWSEMPGWMKHNLESRFPGEISVTSDTQMTTPLWQKVKKN